MPEQNADANIYVWHKSNDRPLEVLTGHGRGCVNDVSWNPASTAMFASAGGQSTTSSLFSDPLADRLLMLVCPISPDDKTVRIWQAPSALDLA